MKKPLTTLTLGLTGLLLTSAASADWQRGSSSYYDEAKVTEVKPIYETVRIAHPERDCWNEQIRYYEPGRRSEVPVVMGTIIGGVAGNQFGEGSGKTAMTVAGALLGAAIGDDIAENGRRHRGYRVAGGRHCEVRQRYEEEERLVGYRVEYRYHGKIFHTRTRHHPGKWLRIRLSVDPVLD